jgi:hypothetical protein
VVVAVVEVQVVVMAESEVVGGVVVESGVAMEVLGVVWD